MMTRRGFFMLAIGATSWRLMRIATRLRRSTFLTPLAYPVHQTALACGGGGGGS